MTPEWLYIYAGAITLCAIGFVCVAVLWLRKLRETVSSALSEAVGQQIVTSQRLSASIADLQKQQDNANQQIQTLAQVGLRMQQEISSVSTRLEVAQNDSPHGGQTLH